MRTRCILILVVAMLLTPTLLDSSAQTQDPFSNSVGLTPIFGPKRYTRLSGSPQNFTESFKHRGTARCQIVVVNGNDDGTKRVIGSIFLNDQRIVSPTDFNQRSSRIVKSVVPADQNQLTISIYSESNNCRYRITDLSLGQP